MAKGTTRYYLEGDHVGITPSQLKKASRSRQTDYMLAWFETYFEDPAQGTPRMDNEFVYPYGGPYDALDVLGDEFGNIVPEIRIVSLADEIQRSGVVDWAPTGRHPDYQRTLGNDPDEATDDGPDQADDTPTLDDLDAADRVQSLAQAELVALNTPEFRFGSAEELEAREALQQEVTALRREVATLRAATAGIGHNNPPDDLEDEDVVQEPTPESTEAVAIVLANELAIPEPDVGKVVKAATRLSRAKEYLISKAKSGLDKGVEKGFENLIAWMPLAVAGTILAALIPLFWAVETALFRWIDVLIALGRGFL